MVKEELLQIILKFILEKPKTQAAEIHQHVFEILKQRGLVGEKTTRHPGYTSTTFVRMSDSDAMLVNEIIYDLIILRVLTPGINADNLEWPWISLTSEEKLRTYLRE
ncbi:hypothetical protein ACJ7K1_32635 [Paenibacillus elgii]